MQKECVLLYKLIYIRMCVLDISKQKHYETINQRYNDKAKLLFTDTNSLCYLIETDNLENDRFKEI